MIPYSYHLVFVWVLVFVERGCSFVFHRSVSSIVPSKTRPSSAAAAMSTISTSVPQDDIPLPSWFQELSTLPNAKPLLVREWMDEEWRVKEGGFQGYDFCHSRQASVRVVDYIMLTPEAKQAETGVNLSVEDVAKPEDSSKQKMVHGENFPRLVGVAYFSPKAESHRGLCHGGSFCALMDDVIGWMGFCTSGEVRPWCGYTVQVNTALRKAVKVGSVLRLEAWVDRKEGSRKFWIKAKLCDEESGEIHCEGDGLFLASKE